MADVSRITLPDGDAYDIKDAVRGVEFIVGTQAEATGEWTGITNRSALFNGMMIKYFLPYAGSGNATLNLTLSGGGTTGAKPVYKSGTTSVTTDYPANSVISLTYSTTKIGTGAWYVDADKDTTYSSREAASGGTDVSLVTTGEKYTWNQKTSNTGTVTKVSTGTGLTGGDITTSGTISLASGVVTAGSAGPTAAVTGTDGKTIAVPRITVDTYGRVTELTSYNLTNKNTWTANSATAAGYVAASGTTAGKAWLSTTGAPAWTAIPTGVKGNSESSYRTGNVNLTPANIGALALSGGTITGNTYIKNTNIDTSTSNNGVSTNTYTSLIGFCDTSTNYLGYIRACAQTDGSTYLQLVCRNKKSDGTNVDNSINIFVWKDGTKHYSVSDPANFRSAIGAAAASSYLPLSGGTMTGAINMNLKSIILYQASSAYSSIYHIASGNVWTIHINAGKGHSGTEDYLNLESNHVQCRNPADTAWTPILASAFSQQSSRRYKENISSITEDRAEKILDVEVVNYDYKDGVTDDKSKQFNRVGVIAEDVIDVIPEVVTKRKVDGVEVPDSVDYAQFVPYLIKMVQMQDKRIKELERRLNEIST